MRMAVGRFSLLPSASASSSHSIPLGGIICSTENLPASCRIRSQKKGLAFLKAAAVLIADELIVMEHDFEKGTDSAELWRGDLPPLAAIGDGLPAAGFVLEDR